MSKRSVSLRTAVAGAGAMLAALTLAALTLNVESSGEAAPLAYVPLLNPLEIASVLVLLAVLRWLGALGRQNPNLEGATRARAPVAGVAVWFLVTMTVARCVHHWAGVPYDLDSLAASTTFQTAGSSDGRPLEAGWVYNTLQMADEVVSIMFKGAVKKSDLSGWVSI